MKDKPIELPAPCITYINVDARDEDVSMELNPAMLFTASVAPGTKITPDDYVPGIALKVGKGRTLHISVLMTDDQALEYLKALATSVVRSVPEKLDQALLMVKQGMEEALKDAASGPGCEGRIQGGSNARIESVEGRRDGDLSGCEEDDPHQKL